MNRQYCEGPGEYAFFDHAEFRDFGGVRVHAVTSGAWHLTNGDVIEMASAGVPLLVDGRPLVDVGLLAVADASDDDDVISSFDVAAEEDSDSA